MTHNMGTQSEETAPRVLIYKNTKYVRKDIYDGIYEQFTKYLDSMLEYLKTLQKEKEDE